VSPPTMRLTQTQLAGGLTALSLAGILSVNAVWLAIDHRPPRWDESANLRFAERAHQLVGAGHPLQALDTEGQPRPNFTPFLSGLSFYLVGHDTQRAIWLLNGAALAGITLAMFGLGLIYFNGWVALLAVVLFNTLPGVALWSRYYNLDLPLCAFVSLTVYLAAWMAHRRRFTGCAPWLLGGLVAMGVGSKHLFAPFVTLPLLWWLAALGRHHQWRARALLASWGAYLPLLLGIAWGGYYHLVLNWAAFKDGVLRSFATERSVLNQAGYTPPTLADKLSSLHHFMFDASPLYSWLLGAGLLAAVLWNRRGLPLLLLWTAGVWGLLLFGVRVTMAYYFYAGLPPLALLAAAWLLPASGRTPDRKT
jgi:4-amino-4-deoxy-L-arabinose transferase-like glycosyltransferase